MLNRKNIVSLVIAVIISGVFLWAILTPPSLFNFLPYQIHEGMKSEKISENLFIKIFDICSAIIVLILSYILTRNFLKTFRFLEKEKTKNL